MDRALDGGPSTGLPEHLLGCTDCRADWTILQRMERQLRASTEPPLPEGFLERTMARLEGTSLAPWPVDPTLRAGLSLLTVVVGLLLILVGAVAVLQALLQPTEVAEWLAWAGTATDVGARLAYLAVPSLGHSLFAWPLYGAVGLVLGLIWFGLLVAPRRALRNAGRR
jgi:hypothetical protein